MHTTTHRVIDCYANLTTKNALDCSFVRKQLGISSDASEAGDEPAPFVGPSGAKPDLGGAISLTPVGAIARNWLYRVLCRDES